MKSDVSFRSFLLKMFLSSLEVLHSVLMSLRLLFAGNEDACRNCKSRVGRDGDEQPTDPNPLSSPRRCAHSAQPATRSHQWAAGTGELLQPLPTPLRETCILFHLTSAVASSFIRPFPSLDQLNGLLWWRMIKVVPPGKESWSSQTKVLPEKPWSVAPRVLCCWPRKEY